MQRVHSGISKMATPASYNMTDTNRKQNKEAKNNETIFLSSPSPSLCYHSFRDALGSFKRNVTGTKWFYCISLINREQTKGKNYSESEFLHLQSCSVVF